MMATWGDLMATSGENRWPPVGNFVATNGEKPMAIDTGTRPAELMKFLAMRNWTGTTRWWLRGPSRAAVGETAKLDGFFRVLAPSGGSASSLGVDSDADPLRRSEECGRCADLLVAYRS